jgi:hypothetical protein
MIKYLDELQLHRVKLSYIKVNKVIYILSNKLSNMKLNQVKLY